MLRCYAVQLPGLRLLQVDCIAIDIAIVSSIGQPIRTQDIKVRDNVLCSDWRPDAIGNVNGNAWCDTAFTHYRREVNAVWFGGGSQFF